MTDTERPSEKKPAKKREQLFPIRHFSKLLDEFLEESKLTATDQIEELEAKVRDALIDHFKK